MTTIGLQSTLKMEVSYSVPTIEINIRRYGVTNHKIIIFPVVRQFIMQIWCPRLQVSWSRNLGFKSLEWLHLSREAFDLKKDQLMIWA